MNSSWILLIAQSLLILMGSTNAASTVQGSMKDSGGSWDGYPFSEGDSEASVTPSFDLGTSTQATFETTSRQTSEVQSLPPNQVLQDARHTPVKNRTLASEKPPANPSHWGTNVTSTNHNNNTTFSGQATSPSPILSSTLKSIHTSSSSPAGFQQISMCLVLILPIGNLILQNVK